MESRVSTIFVLIVCLSLVSSIEAGARRHNVRRGPANPIQATEFNVLNYGAKPGKNQESTQAFVKAWNAACRFNGNARLVIPRGVYKLGETVFQGPCKSTTPITVLLEGTLQAVSDVSVYPGKGWINIDEVNGIVLTGGGTIDGQGPNVWEYNDCKTNPNCVHLPASIYMTKVQNAKIKSIHLLNSMGFTMHITHSNLVRVHSITITTPADSPNTDGIHISKCNTVKISRSVIKSGDDCISVGPGSTNVTMNQITCGPGHGLSVGSLGKRPKELDVQGLIVKNCTLIGTDNGLRIKTYPASDPSKASGMLFKDIVMYNVRNPIIINQNYGSKSTQPSLVKISDVFYQNIVGTTDSPNPVNLMCSSKVPCQNVRFHNINLKYTGKEKASAMCSNAKVGYSGLQNPPPC